MEVFALVVLAAPLAVLSVALLSVLKPGRRPGMLPRIAELAALAALAFAGAGLAQLVATGPSTLSAADGLIAIRLDAVSVTMTLLVAFVGWVVVRYSRTYLDGEAREGAFHGWMLAALGSVLLLVQAGSLPVLIAAFVAVGLAMRRLLLFYPDRPEARRAAAKFTLVWGAGDTALIVASVLLVSVYGTSDIAALNVAAAGGLTAGAQVAVALIVLTAVLKTASFPLHGWLTEVMEAPTPVSALLHAGIINSGGVLLIVTAGLVEASTGALAALVMLGGFTALFGGVVMLTQSAVKTALAWSTVAQMGFMLLQCGLGLWPLALLHIVAHSLYKAHAFLASGGAVQAVLQVRRPGAIAVPNLGRGAVLRTGTGALCRRRLGLWPDRRAEIGAGACARCDPHFRRGLPGGTGTCGCRAACADAADGARLARCGRGLFRLPDHRGTALGAVPADHAGARPARMGAHCAGGDLLRAGRHRTGAVPALGASPGDGGPARAYRQWALPQRAARPGHRRAENHQGTLKTKRGY